MLKKADYSCGSAVFGQSFISLDQTNNFYTQTHVPQPQISKTSIFLSSSDI